MDDLYREMKWQQNLRNQGKLWWIAKYDELWSTMAFQIAIILNLIVGLFYPWDRDPSRKCMNAPHSANIGPELMINDSVSSEHVLDQATAIDDSCNVQISYTKEYLIGIILTLMHIFSTIFDETTDRFEKIKSLCYKLLCWLILVQLLIMYKKSQVMFFIGILNFFVKCIYMISFIGNRGLLQSEQILSNTEFFWHLGLLLLSVLGMSCERCVFFYAFLLFDLVFREETLANVIRSVTVNGRSIFLTTMLLIILVYMFSIIGFLMFQKHFELRLEDDDEETDEFEGHCSTLLMCIVTTLNNGLRSGGGIGDVLAPVSIWDDSFYPRVLYDLMFFFVLIIIVLNLIFGVIIDTFGALREEKEEEEEVLKNSCFICGLRRADFDQLNSKTSSSSRNQQDNSLNSGHDRHSGPTARSIQNRRSGKEGITSNEFNQTNLMRSPQDVSGSLVRNSPSTKDYAESVTGSVFNDHSKNSENDDDTLGFNRSHHGGILTTISRQAPSFDHHISHEHNMWHYVYFITYMKIKEQTEFTGPESYVSRLIEQDSVEWFPKGKAISLQLFREEMSKDNDNSLAEMGPGGGPGGDGNFGGQSSSALSKRLVDDFRIKLDSNIDAIEHLALALKSVQSLVNEHLKKEQDRKRQEQLEKRIRNSQTAINSQGEIYGNSHYQGYGGHSGSSHHGHGQGTGQTNALYGHHHHQNPGVQHYGQPVAYRQFSGGHDQFPASSGIQWGWGGKSDLYEYSSFASLIFLLNLPLSHHSFQSPPKKHQFYPRKSNTISENITRLGPDGNIIRNQTNRNIISKVKEREINNAQNNPKKMIRSNTDEYDERRHGSVGENREAPGVSGSGGKVEN